jgi:adenylate cyclase
MPLRIRPRAEWLWGLAAVVAVAAVWLADPGGTATRMRERAFETLGWLFPRVGGPEFVAVIDIDRDSLARLGPWPWRRKLIADLVTKAGASGPRAVAIDILLSGPDRRGPAALARDLVAMDPAVKLDPATLADDDAILADAIAAGNVVLGILLDNAGRDEAPPPPPLSAEGALEGVTPMSARGVVAPFATLSAGAAGTGIMSFHAGVLGDVVSAPVIAQAAGEVFPGFALEAVRVAEGAAFLVSRSHPNRIAAGGVEVPVDEAGGMRIWFAAPDASARRTISAWRLLADTARPALSGKIVLIGSSAPEAGAFLPAPGGELAPTVQIEAEAIEAMLSGRFLRRAPSMLPLELAAMLSLGAVAVGIAALSPPSLAALAVAALIATWAGISAALFARTGLMLDPTGPALAVFLGGNAAALAAFVQTRRLKTAIQGKFERYVSPDVVASLLRAPEALRLKGEMKEVTAILTDVEGFTRTTELSEPRQLVQALDGYFDAVTELVVGHGGMVDKIVGDAVLAFFNIPTPLPHHTDAAVRCAQAILAATDAYRSRPEAAEIQFGRTRIGIETGTAIVGDVGGRRRLDYTAYGAVVNKAARLQALNKELGSSICIGPAAAAALSPDIRLRPLGRAVLRGMQASVEVFEPFAPERWDGTAADSSRDPRREIS